MEPKILASGKFSPNDLLVTISESNRMIDPFVESKIEAVWGNMVKNAEENKLNLYNGISYRLNSFEECDGKLLIDLGTFEYKVRDGLLQIPEYFNLSEPYWRKGCFTQATIRTADRHYLIAELSGKSMNTNTTDLIGGVVEVPPEIEDGDGIFNSLHTELREESLIYLTDIAKCSLKAVFITNNHNVGFYFEVVLKISSEELSERYGCTDMDVDIKSIKSLSREGYLETLHTHRSPNKKLIAGLVSI